MLDFLELSKLLLTWNTHELIRRIRQCFQMLTGAEPMIDVITYVAYNEFITILNVILRQTLLPFAFFFHEEIRNHSLFLRALLLFQSRLPLFTTRGFFFIFFSNCMRMPNRTKLGFLYRLHIAISELGPRSLFRCHRIV